MKYQALKALKTKSKLLKLCDTLKEAHEVIKDNGGVFIEFSYYGGFPVYKSDKHVFNIQGLYEGLNIVLGLSDEEKAQFDFSS